MCLLITLAKAAYVREDGFDGLQKRFDVAVNEVMVELSEMSVEKNEPDLSSLC